MKTSERPPAILGARLGTWQLTIARRRASSSRRCGRHRHIMPHWSTATRRSREGLRGLGRQARGDFRHHKCRIRADAAALRARRQAEPCEPAPLRRESPAIHWPNAQIPLAETIARCADEEERLCAPHRRLNFTVALVEEAVKFSSANRSLTTRSNVTPTRRECRAGRMQKHGIARHGPTADRARPRVGDEILTRVGAKYGKTRAKSRCAGSSRRRDRDPAHSKVERLTRT